MEGDDMGTMDSTVDEVDPVMREPGPAGAGRTDPAPRSQAIEVDDVSVKYSSRRKAETHVLDRVRFSVRPSEFLAIVGPSGCGKSTLLKVVAGLIPPSAGGITFGAGQTYRDQRIGFLFQADALLPWKTAADNVSVAFRLGTGDQGRAHERSVELMTHLGLEGAADKYPHQLSGGMRKRVALARTLAYNPTVFLLDEPFGALDAQTRVTVGNFFLQILEESKQTVLFVTHDIEEAVTLADRILVLSAGPASSVVREFRIDTPRPRDYYESRFFPGSAELQREIWASLRTAEEAE
ncbi:MAG TPA: ABC transporter ATP-binding protein [Pseudonocardiaceae bacterium]|nr:ABC transporter ATP-binding protein [Pseudonocardiaceae bacterium]